MLKQIVGGKKQLRDIQHKKLKEEGTKTQEKSSKNYDLNSYNKSYNSTRNDNKDQKIGDNKATMRGLPVTIGFSTGQRHTDSALYSCWS